MKFSTMVGKDRLRDVITQVELQTEQYKIAKVRLSTLCEDGMIMKYGFNTEEDKPI